MVTIRDAAIKYEAVKTKNITELDEVSTELDVEEKTFKQDTPDEFTVLVTQIDGEEYRVPKTVLSQLNQILAEKPAVTKFKVNKVGTGLNTKYTVITLD